MNKQITFFLVSLTVIPISLVGCGNIENGSNTLTQRIADTRQCRTGIARPIAVLTALRVIREHGFAVVPVRDEGICSAKDMIAVLDNTESRGYDKVLNTEGHVNCGIRKRPIYRNHVEIVKSEYGNWSELRYENLECGLEKTGAGGTTEGRARFHEIFEQLKRG
jgi:hypothetical protein